MFKKFVKVASVAAAVTFGAVFGAQAWTLDGDASKLAFGSVKKDKVGEVHTFESISGKVTPEGDVSIEIDLTSVQTNIEIRDERMNEFVFGGVATANLKTKIDMSEVDALKVGETTTIDVEGALSFLGADVPIEAEMFVARLSETKVMVTTNDMIFVGVEDLGISAGIDKLMELAKLPGITRTVPVTLRLVFNNEVKKAEAAPAAPANTEVAALVTGDVKAGKKVFKRCKACHSLTEGKNGNGPSLHAIVGKAAGSIDGYKYSKALAESGLTWDVETLSAFLAKPKSVVKGTKMAFSGLKKDKQIEDVIAYIASKNE